MAQGRPVDRTRPRLEQVDQAKPDGAADGRCRAIAVAQGVEGARRADLLADRPVDHDQDGAAAGAGRRAMQPAITALIASFSAVIAMPRTGSMPISWSGGIITQSRQARTASSVGGTIGRPSVQPLE